MFKQQFCEWRRQVRIRVVEIELARAEGRYESFVALFKEQKGYTVTERDTVVKLRGYRDGLKKELELLKGQLKERVNGTAKE